MGRIYNKIIRKITQSIEKNGLEQDLNTKDLTGELLFPEFSKYAREAAAEGIVLLKNDNATLPIRSEDKVAVFGRCAWDYFVVGYGSGGDTCYPYKVNAIEGLKNHGVLMDEELQQAYQKWLSKPANEADEGFWGHWPMNFPEMPLGDSLVKEVADRCDMALVIIGRAAGEDRENLKKKGSFYLTDLEEKMLNQVCENFDRVAVVMDCGNIMDMSWMQTYQDKIGSLVYAWQGGMESGNALADVLTGAVNPSAKLTDSIAINYEDYPSAEHFGGKKSNNYVEDIYVGYRYFETFAKEKVLYPFGFGLSYTEFSVDSQMTYRERAFDVKTQVTNTGDCAGKEVVLVYVNTPDGSLATPDRNLAAFAKTNLLQPNETEELVMSVNLKDLASYDDSGATGHKSAYVLLKGTYEIYVGSDVRSAKKIGEIILDADEVVSQLSEACPVEVQSAFKRMDKADGKLVYTDVAVQTEDKRSKILSNLPEEVAYSGDQGIKFSQVLDGEHTLDEFIAQLTPEDLDDISHGEGKMNSSLGIVGNAGALGGITERLRELGVPPVITTDGPSGIRIKRTCTLLPCGTALASSFNEKMVEELYGYIAKEMKSYGSDMLLAPGMNIHRNPLCGRNFEYYSEDPYVSGKIAAAAIRGIQSQGASACPKHFACNNQETKRNTNNSIVSERALREIYLKGFEIAIKEGHPLALMTSYNKVNGVWSHYNYDLVTAILRDEWGYDGLVITDWWMQVSTSPEFPEIENDGYRVRAQVDVLMPGGDGFLKSSKVGRKLLDTYGKQDGITLGEMQRTAKNVLKLCLSLEKSKKEKTW